LFPAFPCFPLLLQTQRMIDGMKNRGEKAEDFREQEGAVIQHYQVRYCGNTDKGFGGWCLGYTLYWH
jgi:hypothetical protein